MTDWSNCQWTLWITPTVGFGHVRRPNFFRRMFQMVFLGWKWKRTVGQGYGMILMPPGSKEYTSHQSDLGFLIRECEGKP